tara:strand:- start:540 stop:1118 length:579 start_codon:yes stop_codon:yes gene_type:complete
MKYANILLVLILLVCSSKAIAGSTQTNVSGSNTAIEGNYTGGSTTYESGSESSSSTTSTNTSNIKSAPGTATSAGVNTSNNCAIALSGGVQTFSIGISGGKSYQDKTCELIALSKTLSGMGMKVAAISLLCTDERVWEAMFMAKTYCPVEGKIGKDAYDLIINKYNYQMPTYEKYVHLETKKKNKIKIEKLK